MSYSFQDIQINNRRVSIHDILQSKEIARTPFEDSTFLFIREWLTGRELFTLQTSGSTGTPKEISLTRNQLKQSALRTISALRLTPNSTVLVCLDTKYIAGKMMLVRALEGNLKIIAAEPSSNPLKENDITTDFIALVPLQLQEILNHSKSAKQLNRFKTVIVGGASINDSLEKAIQNISGAVYATYGMTETVSHIALQRLNGNGKSDHFTILPNIKIEKDERGCLVIGLPEFDEKIFTNDLVELLDEKTFQWLGRWDAVINSGGFKIYPEKVEREVSNAFESLSMQRPFFIAGMPDERLGNMVVLVLEGAPLTNETESLLFSKLKETLHAYEVPKGFVYSPQFILTETGKINRTKTILTLQ